jgi:hypothetical protein
MVKTKRRLSEILAGIAFTIAAASIVALAVLAARAKAQRPLPAPAELRTAPEVRALGHAHPVRGGPGKYGSARYAYRIELLDGRTGSYVSDRLISASRCVEVIAREHQGRLIIVKLVEQDGGCERDALGELTR